MSLAAGSEGRLWPARGTRVLAGTLIPGDHLTIPHRTVTSVEPEKGGLHVVTRAANGREFHYHWRTSTPVLID